MTDFKEVLGRVDIQLIRSFLLCGVGEPGEQDTRPYIQRIKEAEHPVYQFFEKKFPDEKELDEAVELLGLP